MSYDPFDRQSRWVFPSKTTPGVADQADFEEYRYDANGNRTSLRKRDGKILGFEYDGLNRMVVKDVPEFGLDVRYSYDLRGLQTAPGSPAAAGACGPTMTGSDGRPPRGPRWAGSPAR